LRKFLAFYDFFGNLFIEKIHPMVSSWRDQYLFLYLSPILASWRSFLFCKFFLTCFLAFRSPQNFCRGFDLFGFIFRFSFSIQKQKLFFYFNGLFFKLLLASSFIDYLFVSFKNHP